MVSHAPSGSLSGLGSIMLLAWGRSETGALAHHIRRAGGQVVIESDQPGAMREIERQAHTAVVIDVGPIDDRVIELCRATRKLKAGRPAVLLSVGESSEQAQVYALKAGADDVLKRPYSGELLVARLSVLLRRRAADTLAIYRAGSSKELPLSFGDVQLFSRRYEAYVDGRLIALTLTEFRLLYQLMSKPDRTFRREELIIDRDDEPRTLRVIDSHIFNLRQKLEPSRVKIKSVRGVGYRMSLDGE